MCLLHHTLGDFSVFVRDEAEAARVSTILIKHNNCVAEGSELAKVLTKVHCEKSKTKGRFEKPSGEYL